MPTKYKTVGSNKSARITVYSPKNLRSENINTNLETIVSEPFLLLSNFIRPCRITFLTTKTFLVGK